MRLNNKEKDVILKTILALDSKAKVYLFGSRTRDELKGGDIDLLVISDGITFPQKLDALATIKSILGDQKIDLLIKTLIEAKKDVFVSSILEGAILLK